jgi:hypothetical protein
MKRTVLAVAALLATAATGMAGERDFIQRPTRINGCVAIIEEVRNGTIAPTEWLEANKEEFKDLELELKARRYPADKAKAFLMGMAISFCMERKGYRNKCVVSPGEDGDVQMMATATVYACWTRNDRAERPVEEPRPPPPVPGPVPGPCPAVRCPEAYMTPPQVADFQEDLAILSGPIAVYHGGGNVYERLASCRDYWAGMVDSTPDRNAGWVRWSVRVRRCMYRTGLVNTCPGMALVPQQGWQQAVAEAQSAHCYRRLS